jgi:hypothetical protein
VRQHFSLGMALAVLSACGPLRLEPVGDAGIDEPEPFDAASILDEFARDGGTRDGQTGAAPTLRITEPRAGAAVEERFRIAGSARDDRGLAAVTVRVGPNQPLPAQSVDGYASWSLEANAPLGPFEVQVSARDVEGQTTTERLMVMRGAAGDVAPPTITITSPANGSSPVQPLVLVEGTAADDRAVVALEVRRNGELLSEREVETSDFFARWSRLVPLLAGQQNTLLFTARDASGQEASATLTLQGRATSDRSPPMLELSAPAAGASLNAAQVELNGRASDESGIREVNVRVGRTPAGASEPAFGDFIKVTTSDGFATFRAALPAPTGAFTLEVLAIDLNGLSTRVTRNLTNTFSAEWSDEVVFPLRLPAETAPSALDFALTKQGIQEVFTEQIQRDVRVLELDTTALITSAVDQIKTSCGTRWRENNPDPRHDCSATDYGRNANPPTTWQRSPEYSMVRLLTMTPANVVVAGTSLENLQGLADALGIGGGFRTILANTLGIPVTQEIVQTASVVRALQDFLISSHPEALPGAKLPISLYDAVNDLSPIADRFGPKGEHPGLLDPAFPPRAMLLTPEFQMRLVATSNLRWLDGIDVAAADGSAQKEYLALVFDATGPTFDDVLEFDFTDPARFDVRGLVPEPRVDMRMLLRENRTFVRTCTAANATCRNNLPESPARGYVWANPKWEIETTVAGAAYYQYQNRRNYTQTYSLLGIPASTVTMGADGNPAGWTTFETLINLGSPPPPQYIWENISEVSQVALHNYGTTMLPEGGVNVAFTLRNVNVGLNADAIREAMRPRLQEQRQKLSERLLGDFRKNNGAVDFYYRRGADGAPYVFFVAASDPLPGDGYPYTKPGFFSDAALTQKASSLEPGTSGDSAHEKLALQAGETTVYMSDAQGTVARLRFVVGQDAREIEVYLSKKVR